MSQSETQIFDKNHLSVSIGIDDCTVLHEIYREYLKRLDIFIDKLDSNDLGEDDLYMEVHTMKASSSSVGAQHLALLIESVEDRLMAERGQGNHQTTLQNLRITAIQTRDLMRIDVVGFDE
jgi:HPt (histidine-containing phosphotransfer) domain-containing protein